METQSGIEYLHAQPEDSEEIYNFHLSYFGDIRSKYVWQWQYGDFNPNQSVLVVGKVNKRVIATQGAMAINLIINGERQITGKNESLLIETEFRKKGVFTAFYDYAFDEYRKVEITCLWGFTKAIGPFKYVGFSFDRIIERAIFPISYSKAIKLSKVDTMPFFKGIIYRIGAVVLSLYARLSLSYYTCFLKVSQNVKIVSHLRRKNDIIDFFALLRQNCPDLIHIHMDSSFLDWRINNSPNEIECYYAYNQDSLRGYLMVEKNKDYTEVLDFNFLTKEDGRSLISSLMNYLTKSKAEFVIYSGNKLNDQNNLVFELLFRYGFFRIKGPNGFVLKILNNVENSKKFDLKNWYITNLWNEGN
ncbi:GNAT family N-acetyltransferase [Williamwhitmania taraxaci]|uniref:Acetyltransferase (GNAT) domain-containing protein n=1 Tax=Williamwhitmania taraxaci TaxID=1640674 RepID=A0A1G6GGY9_9BACT|nr:GNAT family N-acetyltransferase [Williamwhitmania taraxaci]SDB81257.1 Acetyltransferase (GNAT) domain-containing protein [Williamwhitmania taraxaci]